MVLQIFNTDGRKLEDFEPQQSDLVKMYCCGPTVYRVAHIGNLRSFVVQDLLRRTLEILGFQVQHVMNITDIGHLCSDGDQGEDKMLRSAREMGLNVWQISEHFSNIFMRDCRLLNILCPQVCCRATDHVQSMISFIEKLQQQGYAYLAGGNVYFDVSRLGESYGRLANLQQQDLQAGKRIQVDAYKKNPQDFALWLTDSKFNDQAMKWSSPWGEGYPGWHIECSAMAMNYLGENIDIHCGGADLAQVHHNNEIAQSEALLKQRWVKYWVHNEFLLIDNSKMAKSEGNFLDLESLQKEGFSPLDYRYFLLSGHYRSQLNFHWDALSTAQKARKKLKQRLVEIESRSSKENPQLLTTYLRDLQEALCRDLNSPQALAVLWKALKDENLGSSALAFAQRCDEVFALDLLSEKSEKRADQLEPELEILWQQRQQARAEKDFARSDSLREQLAAAGIMVLDDTQGSSWRRMVTECPTDRCKPGVGKI